MRNEEIYSSQLITRIDIAITPFIVYSLNYRNKGITRKKSSNSFFPAGYRRGIIEYMRQRFTLNDFLGVFGTQFKTGNIERVENGFIYGDQEPGTGGIRPIDKTVFKNLDIPCFELSPENAQKIIQGKPLAYILKDNSPVSGGEKTAALFSGDTFIAVIERINDKWSYGYVNARD